MVKLSAGPTNSSASAAFTRIRSRLISTMISLSAASFSMHTADTIAACSLSFFRTSDSANVVLKAFYQLICMAGRPFGHLTLIHVHRVNTWGNITCENDFGFFNKPAKSVLFTSCKHNCDCLQYVILLFSLIDLWNGKWCYILNGNKDLLPEWTVLKTACNLNIKSKPIRQLACPAKLYPIRVRSEALQGCWLTWPHPVLSTMNKYT